MSAALDAAPVSLPRAAPRAGLLHAAARRLRYVAAAVIAVAVAAPVGVLEHGTRRARACVASYEAPRGAALPDCRDEVRWFVTPSRIPWTATSARYRAEEINMRQAIAAYRDAAIGTPDTAALGRAADGVVAAEKVIRAGSQRVALEELGRAVGAPDLGRSAMLLGDRRTTVTRADEWPHWSARKRALEDALLEADFVRAKAIAQRYAEFDPRDDDLRVTVAGVLCLVGEGERGLRMMTTVQAARARDRHESWARNYGELRAMMVACAAAARLPAPPLPESREGGVADLVDARTALRLRLLARGHERDPFLIRDAARDVADMLDKGPLPRGERVPLLAGLLALGRTLEAAEVASLATPREALGEPPLRGAAIDLTAVEWLERGRGIEVRATRDALRTAAATLRRMAASAEVSAAEKEKLREAAVATAIAAARAFAVAHEPDAAAAELDAAGADLGARGPLGRSSAWYLAGDAARALEALDRAAAPALGDDKHAAAIAVATKLQRAELLASLGRREEAAREAVAADEAAAALGDRAVDLRAQWTRLALARSRRGAALPATWMPWTGVMATSAAWLDAAAEGPAVFASALATWDAALRAPAEQRRALRYQLVERNAGDAPRARVMQLHLAGGLLAAGEGDVEIWLDAFAAVASRGTSMRAYAWARAEAARLRGDAAAASKWAGKYVQLAKIAAPDDAGEIAGALGI